MQYFVDNLDSDWRIVYYFWRYVLLLVGWLNSCSVQSIYNNIFTWYTYHIKCKGICTWKRFYAHRKLSSFKHNLGPFFTIKTKVEIFYTRHLNYAPALTSPQWQLCTLSNYVQQNSKLVVNTVCCKQSGVACSLTGILSSTRNLHCLLIKLAANRRVFTFETFRQIPILSQIFQKSSRLSVCRSLSTTLTVTPECAERLGWIDIRWLCILLSKQDRWSCNSQKCFRLHSPEARPAAFVLPRPVLPSNFASTGMSGGSVMCICSCF